MNFKLPENQILTLASGPDVLQSAASHICRICSDLLPDLSEITVLLSKEQATYSLHQALLAEAEKLGHQALLSARIMPIQHYVSEHASAVTQRLITDNERLLILVSELRHYQTLYGSGSPWLLAQNLLQLFDELIMNQLSLPESTETFFQQLSMAYGLTADNHSLQREARLVLTLWRAWQEHLENESLIDPKQLYLHQLTTGLQNKNANGRVFVLGLLDISIAEQHYLEKLSQQIPLYVLRLGAGAAGDVLPETGLCATSHSSSSASFSKFLDACYNWQQDALRQRISTFKTQHPKSPATGKLHILGVDHFEQQAQAISLFIRSALAEGSHKIGVVCEDRLLARRLRALLERSNIILHDAVGWALSTTHAAAVVESWLECIELDFPHQAFLDLLKSPALVESEQDPILKIIYRFENDIVLHENVGSGLDRYVNAIKYRSQRFDHWSDESRHALLALLQKFHKAAEPLQLFQTGNFDAASALQALVSSLHHFPTTDFFHTDAAADHIQLVLSKLLLAASQQKISMNWHELRHWIGRTLETTYFQPDQRGPGNVVLLTLQQSYMQHFNSLVVAAADEKHLSSDIAYLPFFNQSVRASLGLPDRNKQLRIKETLFRNLLESSESTLLIWQKENNGEPINASHWVAALSMFHKQVYGTSLEPQALKQWLHQPELIPSETDNSVPLLPAGQPTPTAGAVNIPTRLSASAHQRLIDCPYRFYIYDILQLKPLDEIRDVLQKSDYGSLVHRCLEAFHIGITRMPGPFLQPIDQETRVAAIQSLSEISQHVFSKDIEDNFQHRAWLQRWLDFAPDYIDWQIEHAKNWKIIEGEKHAEFSLDADTSVHGRIDRVETSVDKLNLVDYKTGIPPKPNEIISGEDVQLISYSLLVQHVTSVQYLGVDGRNGVNDKSIIEDEELKILQHAIKERLIDLMARIRKNEPMPANGDDKTCGYCDAKGVCRQAAWH